MRTLIINATQINENEMYVCVLGVFGGIYINVLSVSMRLNVIFCIYEHIKTKKMKIEMVEVPKTCF